MFSNYLSMSCLKEEKLLHMLRVGKGIVFT
jgi:hypothetical protein